MEKITLPETGFMRLKQILQFIPIGQTTWRNGVREKTFPQPVKIANVHLWRVEDIKHLIESYSSENSTGGSNE